MSSKATLEDLKARPLADVAIVDGICVLELVLQISTIRLLLPETEKLAISFFVYLDKYLSIPKYTTR